jgi:hypothetical protein
MSISYNTYYSMPYLPDYAAASAHEAAVKPIRGDAEGRKPLGRRDQKWRRIQREDGGSIIISDDWRGDALAAWYIRYTPDNELHIYDVCWSNKATHNEVILRVTGLNLFTEAGRMWARYDGGTVPVSARARPRWVWDEEAYAGRYIKEGTEPEPTIFVRNERGNWVCKNPARIITHQVDRKGAKAVRQRYAAGLTYIKALASLRRDNIPKREELVAAFRDTLLKDVKDEDLKYYYQTDNEVPPVTDHRFTRARAAQLAAFIGSDDPGDQYKAFLWLMHGAYETEAALNRAERVLTMHHHDEWLKKVEHEPGSKAIDRYKWAVPQTQTA